MANDPVIDVSGLSVTLRHDDLRVPLTQGVSFAIQPGDVLALVGESGSGKSVTALSIMQLLGKMLEIEAGSITFRGRGEEPVEITSLGRKGPGIESIRGGRIGMIFQEPMSCFSPIHTIGDQIAEVVLQHQDVSHKAARDRVIDLLNRVEVPRAEEAFNTYPDEYSGGMRQRAMIARALVCRPSLLIADEPTTALDVTIQAQILELLMTLRQEMGMAILFITHNLGIVAQIADRIAVMYAGRIVESGDVRRVFREPVHPYTRALLNAVPRLGDLGQARRLAPIPGTVPNIFEPREGCAFFPRCAQSIAGTCDRDVPPFRSVGDGAVECYLAEREAV
jgi:oligopeptide/dipeptide ABC transporter ATP-binding protein